MFVSFRINSLLLAAAAATLAGCSVGPGENGQSSSLLTATLSGADQPAAASDLQKGTFKLYCDGSAASIADAQLANSKLAFKLASGASVSAGSACYVNMELAAADRPAGKVTFYQGESVFYATNKAPVVNAGDHNEIKLELFKSYSVQGDASAQSLTAINATIALLSAGKTDAVAMPGKLTVDQCAHQKDATLIAAAVLVTGKTSMLVSYDKVSKDLLGDSCRIKFLADTSRQAFKSAAPVVLAETIGSDAAPLKLLEIVEGTISVDISLHGSCRVFDQNRECAFVFPEECSLPLGEVAGAYDQGKWLHCAALAAASSIQSANRNGVQIQQQSDRSKVLRLLQALQQVEDQFAQSKIPDQVAFISARVAMAKSITATDTSGLGVKDPGLVYGTNILVKVLGDISAKLQVVKNPY